LSTFIGVSLHDLGEVQRTMRAAYTRVPGGSRGKAPPQPPRGLKVPGDIELRDGAALMERVLDALWVGGVTGDVRRNTGASHYLDRVRELFGERPGELERPDVEIPAEAVGAAAIP